MDVHQICPVCKDGFYTTDERIRHNRGKYCSDACKNIGKTNQIPCVCLICSTNFTVNQHRIDRGFGKYCSMPCVYKSRAVTPEHKAEVKRKNNAAWMREWNATHKEEKAQRDAQYRKDKPEIKRAADKRRRARKRGAPVNDFTAEQWYEMKKAYTFHCAYCAGIFDEAALTMDHIVPLIKNGSHTGNNIVPACLRCNSKKGQGELPILYKCSKAIT